MVVRLCSAGRTSKLKGSCDTACVGGSASIASTEINMSQSIAPKLHPHHVGFTGTQRGMTATQFAAVSELLLRWFPHELTRPTRAATFHHGDCIGADEQAHVIARICGYFIVGHPPTDPTKRARCAFDFTMTPAPYLNRNAAIVTSTEALIATPGETTEQRRSGTWATIRRARALRRPTTIVWPDGTHTET